MRTTERQEQLSEYEHERGKPRPSLLHSVTQTNLLRHLIERHPDSRPLNELTLRLDDRKLTLDIPVYGDKARFMLEHGVESCWIVQPPLPTITIFTPNMESTTYSSGTVTDPATEIEVDLEDVFSTG